MQTQKKKHDQINLSLSYIFLRLSLIFSDIQKFISLAIYAPKYISYTMQNQRRSLSPLTKKYLKHSQIPAYKMEKHVKSFPNDKIQIQDSQHLIIVTATELTKSYKTVCQITEEVLRDNNSPISEMHSFRKALFSIIDKEQDSIANIFTIAKHSVTFHFTKKMNSRLPSTKKAVYTPHDLEHIEKLIEEKILDFIEMTKKEKKEFQDMANGEIQKHKQFLCQQYQALEQQEQNLIHQKLNDEYPQFKDKLNQYLQEETKKIEAKFQFATMKINSQIESRQTEMEQISLNLSETLSKELEEKIEERVRDENEKYKKEVQIKLKKEIDALNIKIQEQTSQVNEIVSSNINKLSRHASFNTAATFQSDKTVGDNLRLSNNSTPGKLLSFQSYDEQKSTKQKLQKDKKEHSVSLIEEEKSRSSSEEKREPEPEDQEKKGEEDVLDAFDMDPALLVESKISSKSKKKESEQSQQNT